MRELWLEPVSREQLKDLQSVLESAPDYTRRVTGALSGGGEAESMLTALPPGKSHEDKFTFGVYVASGMVGCVDLIRGYPDRPTAFLGLLLFSEQVQKQGLGSAAYALIEKEVRAWGVCSKIRLGVVRANDVVLPFWRKQGFRETGEVKPFRSGSVESETILMEKNL